VAQRSQRPYSFRSFSSSAFNDFRSAGISIVQTNSLELEMLRSLTSRFAAVVTLTFVVSTVALSGPPWIAVEYPVNPHDPNTRGAFMTVRTYHHGDLMAYEITGSAEGLVDGKRQSAKLDIRRLPQAGTYVVRWQKPAKGSWALHISTTRDGNHMASALVDIDVSGRVASVSEPSRPIEGGRWLVPRQVAAAEIDAALRSGGDLASR
jgi:hypothetical protein